MAGDNSSNGGAVQQQQKAADRLNQVSQHLSGKSGSGGDNAQSSDDEGHASSSPSSSSRQNPSRAQRRKKNKSSPRGDDALPADYSDIRGQLATLRRLAATPDPSHRGYARQKQSGKLWVRERVDRLLDPGSFVEVGSVSGEVQWKPREGGDGGSKGEEVVGFTPSNNVQGFGKMGGRKMLFTADDFSLRAGHADGALMDKTVYMEKLCLSLRLPIIKLVDGSSGGGSVTTIRQAGWSYVPPMQGFGQVIAQLNAGIPNLGAVLGPAVGLGAARVTACHFSVMAADIGSLFNAGPKVVAGATFEEGLSPKELGGPIMHCTNGTIDNLAPDEAGCFEQLRTVLSYLPNSGTQIPPVLSAAACDSVERESPELRSIIPRRRERMYDPRRIITTVVDHDSFFEIGSFWGTTAIVGLARIGGMPVGVISMNCEVNAGALDALGSQKITKHLKLLDIFNIPALQFVDIPGYAIGTVAERTATMRHGIALAATYYTTTIPLFSVITRRVYGVAGGVMVDSRDPHARVAWPSGEWGSLPLDGGIEVGHSHELKSIRSLPEEQGGGEAGWKRRYEELEREYKRLQNPVRTANAFGVEEIIDPAQTRRVVAGWLAHVYEALLPERVGQRVAGVLRPVFV